MIATGTENQPQPDNSSKDLPQIGEQIQQVLKELGLDIELETVNFTVSHIHHGLRWIFAKAGIPNADVGILIHDLGETLVAMVDGENGQMLVINPQVFEQIEAASALAKENQVEIEELEISLDCRLKEIPTINCFLPDYLEHVGVEEGAHWIQGLVSSGGEFPGFVKLGEGTRIGDDEDEDENEILDKYLRERDLLAEQTKPHEINAKYWVNEYFKEKYHDESPWEDLYQALKKIAAKRESKKKPPKKIDLRQIFRGK